MTVYRNSYFIGERVRWEASQEDNRSAGTGVVDSIRVSMFDRQIYRVERDVSDAVGRRYEFLEEHEIQRVEQEEEVA